MENSKYGNDRLNVVQTQIVRKIVLDCQEY